MLAERLRSHGCAFTESMFFPTAGGSRRLRSDADGHCIEFWRWDVAGHLDASAERGWTARRLIIAVARCHHVHKWAHKRPERRSHQEGPRM